MSQIGTVDCHSTLCWHGERKARIRSLQGNLICEIENTEMWGHQFYPAGNRSPGDKSLFFLLATGGPAAIASNFLFIQLPRIIPVDMKLSALSCPNASIPNAGGSISEGLAGRRLKMHQIRPHLHFVTICIYIIRFQSLLAW